MSVIVQGLPDAPRCASTGASTDPLCDVRAGLTQRCGLSTGNAPGLVGEVLGKYPPRRHGLCTTALVRQAQELLDADAADRRGHGNFGSVRQATHPAAMRYTESRLQHFNTPTACSKTIAAETVDFHRHFDGSQQERRPVMPARLPTAAEGSSGKMRRRDGPPHSPPNNLTELINRVLALIATRNRRAA